MVKYRVRSSVTSAIFVSFLPKLVTGPLVRSFLFRSRSLCSFYFLAQFSLSLPCLILCLLACFTTFCTLSWFRGKIPGSESLTCHFASKQHFETRASYSYLILQLWPIAFLYVLCGLMTCYCGNVFIDGKTRSWVKAFILTCYEHIRVTSKESSNDYISSSFEPWFWGVYFLIFCCFRWFSSQASNRDDSFFTACFSRDFLRLKAGCKTTQL